MTGSGRPGNGIPADIQTGIAHPARVYDYWLGGKDKFARYCPVPGSCSTSPSLPGCCSSGACITSQIPTTRRPSWPGT